MKNTIKNIFLVALGVVCMYYAFRDLNFHELYDGLKRSNFYWVFLAIVANGVSHFIRALRWKMFINLINHRVDSLKDMYMAEMSGYFSNFLFPRLGEYVRGRALMRLGGVPFSTAINSIILERVIDAISFLAICGITVLIIGPKLLSGFSFITTKKILIYGAVVVIITIVLFLIKKVREALLNWLVSLFVLVKSLFKPLIMLKTILYTAAIWGTFLLSGYFLFYSTKATSHLGATAALVVFVTSNLGFAAPVQGGGAGAYHFLVASSLLIFGVSINDGYVYATLSHIAQLLLGVFVGGICALIVFFRKKYKKL